MEGSKRKCLLIHRKLSACCKALELEGINIHYNVAELVGITKHTWPLMLETEFYILQDARSFQVFCPDVCSGILGSTSLTRQSDRSLPSSTGIPLTSAL